ncbi:MAG: type II secretion system F family protein [Planctomycetaceae bacterium]|nr:type II secretion system F family protein [Planctomycetaceae bacterium]
MLFTWIALALIAVGAGYGLYQMARGNGLSSNEELRRRHGLPSVFSEDESGSQTSHRFAAGEPPQRRTETTPAAAEVSATRTAADAAATAAEATVSAGAHSAETPLPMFTVGKTSAHSSGPLFSELEGIVRQSSVVVAGRPRPEELPIPEDDLFFGPSTPALAEMLPESTSRIDRQRRDLVAAGYHSRAAWMNLNAVRFVLAFLALVIGGFWLLMAPPQLEVLMLGFVVLAPLFMWALPPLLVSHQAAERKIDIERGLPDVLDMLNMGVSQGLTVPNALRRISREISPAHPALGRELSIVNRQAEVGTLSDALRAFSQRIDSPEVSSFTSLLMQSESTGTSISRALHEYSDSMRNSLKERADTRANAASFKLLFPTTLCLMPSVFLFLLGPAIVDMTNFFENTASTLVENRAEAVQSLEQQPVVVPDNQ